ncbi:MAG: hypothetical protein CMI16_08985 [Opitutaceae bacterium]|nr:hypothetical protein [Opitutaceae bacterium]
MFGLPMELYLLLVLVLANGILSMAETAVVSARKTLLEKESDEKGDTASTVLTLVRNPTRFLAFVQLWLTFSSMSAGVIGALYLAGPIAARLESYSVFIGWCHPLALLLVTIGLTTCLLLFGELIPKRLGLAHPENVARFLAGGIRVLTNLVTPILVVFESATALFVRLVRLRPRTAAHSIDDEEVRDLVEQGLHAGVFNTAEKEMVNSVLELDDSAITDLMTPRPKIVFLNLDDSQEVNWRKIVTSGHSYFPVYQSNRDQIVGLVSVKSLWAHSAVGLPTSLKNLLDTPLTVDENLTAIQLVELFKKTGKHIAIVADEFGAVQGLVTLLDVLEAIVGDLPDIGPNSEPPSAHQREDGSWLIDATLPISEFKELIDIDSTLPHEKEADFQTIAGFVMTQFGRIPKAGNRFDWNTLRFEVMDMDRHRVDKILVTRLEPVDEESEDNSAS